MSDKASEYEKFICVEMTHGGENKKLHEIHIPKLSQPKAYTQIISYDAFRSGTRAGASKEDKNFHRATCAWGPEKLYYLKAEWEWKEDVERSHASMKKHLPDYKLSDEYPEAGDATKVDDIPRQTHESIWDFYKAIGFDHKKRAYVDDKGKPIKYSVVKPKPKVKPDQSPEI